MRDAVATSRPSNLGTPVEPSLKRLRSVVSSSFVESSMVEHPPRMQTNSRVVNPMASMFKAVAEAAEGAVKFKSSASVFNRLGCDMHQSDGIMQLKDNQYQEQSPLLYHKNNDYGDQYAANMTTFEHETGIPFDSTSDNEGFDDVNFTGNRVSRVSQLGSYGGKRGDDSLAAHYSVAKNDDCTLLKKNRNQQQSAATLENSEIVNVNLNAWNPPIPAQYHKPRSGLSMVNENAKMVKIDDGKVSCFTCLQSDETWSFC